MYPTPTTVAAIDVGTHAVLLHVARREAGGSIVPLVDRCEFARLGRGVDRTGRLSDEGVRAALGVLRRYAEEAGKAEAGRIAAVGTSALRDARNRGPFLREAEAILGAPLEVIAGLREAELTFRGALVGLPPLGPEPVTVFDVGGGSTEVVRGRPGRIEAAVSLNVGTVRLTERHVAHDPPAPAERAAVLDAVGAALDESGVNSSMPLVGIAGTVTTLAAVARGVDPFDPVRVHGTALGRDEVARVARRLEGLDFARRARVPGLHPDRAETIIAGGLLVEAVMDAAGANHLLVSNGGVRVGLALEMLEGTFSERNPGD